MTDASSCNVLEKLQMLFVTTFLIIKVQYDPLLVLGVVHPPEVSATLVAMEIMAGFVVFVALAATEISIVTPQR